jgi:hypothetical protein
MNHHPDITKTADRFPTGDDRYNPVPVGDSPTLDQRAEPGEGRIPLFRGPFVVTFVNRDLARTLYVASCVRYDEERKKAFVEAMSMSDDRPVRIYPGTVTTPAADGSVVVENTVDASYPVGETFQFRPLQLEDYTWMGVPEQDDIASLGRLYYRFGDM